MPGDVTVAPILDIDAPISVEIGNGITVTAVSIAHESRAMRQVKDTQGLAYDLVNNVVIAAVKARPGKRSDAGDSRSSQLRPVMRAAQRDESVLLPRQIDVDRQLHIFLRQRCQPYS